MEAKLRLQSLSNLGMGWSLARFMWGCVALTTVLEGWMDQFQVSKISYTIILILIFLFAEVLPIYFSLQTSTLACLVEMVSNQHHNQPILAGVATFGPLLNAVDGETNSSSKPFAKDVGYAKTLYQGTYKSPERPNSTTRSEPSQPLLDFLDDKDSINGGSSIKSVNISFRDGNSSAASNRSHRNYSPVLAPPSLQSRIVDNSIQNTSIREVNHSNIHNSSSDSIDQPMHQARSLSSDEGLLSRRSSSSPAVAW
eukprot:CAMPEP_0170064806 /NCGR_PEP_ID=MMETSP0019_2-20121128/5138_1 /TAXON_ID=98059 /ORGANISM="Dinobryon sp., Strain UTEXLB2267" /LENGTH=253 /DNA_ID=CAMNT_0010271533 /DNA_START=563 /DNA_END=1321 /DNA_ORIENTATION=-